MRLLMHPDLNIPGTSTKIYIYTSSLKHILNLFIIELKGPDGHDYF